MYLTHRCCLIIQILINQNEPIALQQLAEALHVSERTIRYDLDLLEEWLESKKVCLKRKPRVGIWLDKESPGYIMLGAVVTEEGEQRIYSKSERKQLIMKLLLEGAEYSLPELTDMLNVSKSTVIRDLNDVKRHLAEYKITLQTHKYLLCEGSELNIRKALANLTYDIYGGTGMSEKKIIQIMENGSIWKEIEITEPVLIQCVKEIQRRLNVVFTDDAVTELIVNLWICLNRFVHSHPVSIPEANIRLVKDTAEFLAVDRVCDLIIRRQVLVELPESERCYYTMHVLGAGIGRSSRRLGEAGKKEIHLRVAVVDFLSGIGKILGKEFIHNQELLSDMLLILRPWIYRARFQVARKVKEPLILERDYLSVVQAVHKNVRILEQYLDVVLDESVTTDLSASVAAACERGEQIPSEKYISAVVVCGAGIGAAKLLSVRIMKEFPQIKVLHELSVEEFRDFDASSVDIVFSAINMQEQPHNMIVVDALLGPESQREIPQYLARLFGNSENSSHYIQKVMMIIENHCIIENRQRLKVELEDFLFPKERYGITHKRSQYSMAALIDSSRIAVNVEAADFGEAIAKGGELLVRSGSVHREYINDMIAHTKQYPSDVVVTPQVALAHASSGVNVSEVCMSLVVLKHAVPFGYAKFDPVRLVVCLGTVDKESHEKAIGDLLKILENKCLLENILNADSVKNILLTINGIW